MVAEREREKKVAVQFGSMRARPSPYSLVESTSIALSIRYKKIARDLCKEYEAKKAGSRLPLPLPCRMVVKEWMVAEVPRAQDSKHSLRRVGASAAA